MFKAGYILRLKFNNTSLGRTDHPLAVETVTRNNEHADR